MADMIRIERYTGFTTLQNDMILDKRLSLKTKGLMAVLLSRPEDWEFSVAGLSAFCGCGRDAIRGALKELEDAGYLSREQKHGEHGKFAGTDYVIREWSSCPEAEPPPLSENPSTVEPSSDLPSSGFPSSGLPPSENPTQRNKDLTKYNPPKSPQGGRRASKSIPNWKPERFEAFWKFYSSHCRPEDRVSAAKEWDRLKPSDELIDTMGVALKRQLQSKEWREGVGIPYACRWLKNRRWEDVQHAPPEHSAPVVETGRLPVW